VGRELNGGKGIGVETRFKSPIKKIIINIMVKIINFKD